ncbi:MAG: class I SAM-dependent methyltransferase [Lachnospiraceae bacterium]|nr:class I SAM-dependent methyltransferase [Lachnospiraceae bacterium]
MAREQYRHFASVYDRMMDNIPYKEWKQYVLKLFYKYGVPPCADITELGCGTGVMTRLLAKDGFNMTGIDISEEMLKVAQAKTSDRVLYKLADMRKFSLDHKQDAIISICDSMNYLITVEDFTKACTCAYNNLSDSGVFIFDLKTEYFFENELDGKTFSENMGDFSYVWKNKYDPVTRIHKYHLLFDCVVDDRREKKEELHKQRCYRASEIKEAAIKAGFTHASVYDAFTFDKPRKKSERIYGVLQKSSL